VQTLFSAIKAALQDQTVVAKLHGAGLEPKLLNAADVTRVLQDQIARWAALIPEAHIKPNDR
jgi:tripartite-type tricarboxylate transporter receptor subunit TctC